MGDSRGGRMESEGLHISKESGEYQEEGGWKKKGEADTPFYTMHLLQD